MAHRCQERLFRARRLGDANIGFEQFVLGELAVCYIRNRADKSHGAPTRIVLRDRARAHPNVLAILTANARFDVKQRRRALEVLYHFLFEFGKIVRMNDRVPIDAR